MLFHERLHSTHCFPSHYSCWKPTATHSVIVHNLVVTLSYSGATIPLVPRKRKVVAPDTSVTSFKMPCTFSLIENVNMGEYIDDLMKVPPPTYYYVQEFLIKFCMEFYYFIHSLYGIEHLYF